jgi:uncharacterized protein (DUF2147 family)
MLLEICSSMRQRILTIITAVLVSAFYASAKAEDFGQDLAAGFWMVKDNEAVVELYTCGDRLCGKFHWLRDDSPQNPSRDGQNPDSDKRKRRLCGLQFMGGFEPKGKGNFENGWIYSPRHGSMFSANISVLDENRLELRGYALIPFLGQSQIWERTSPEPACKFPKNRE